jgi:two-component system cell cycle response regulator
MYFYVDILYDDVDLRGGLGPGVPDEQMIYEPENGNDLTQKVEVKHIRSLRKTNDCLVLIYTEGPDLGKRFDLKGRIISIGRDPDNEICLDEETVSRKHSRIEKKGGKTTIIDLESTNGTYLNDRRLDPQVEYVLNDGDRAKIGRSIFKYLSGNAIETQYYEEIHRMAILDGLTNLFNKRYFIEALDKEVARARRYKRPLSLIMFDIDFFKSVNDTYGHLAGDHILKELGELLKSRVRREEIVARYGGEELVILLPETDKDGAVMVAEQMRDKVENHVFLFANKKIKITVSGGVAEVMESDYDFNELIAYTDERLYVAKKAGRNKVVSTHIRKK